MVSDDLIFTEGENHKYFYNVSRRDFGRLLPIVSTPTEVKLEGCQNVPRHPGDMLRSAKVKLGSRNF